MSRKVFFGGGGGKRGYGFGTSGGASDNKVKINADDSTGDYLATKLTASAPLEATVGDTPGGKYMGLSVQNLYGAWNKYCVPVTDFYDPTSGLPADPSEGDRYIATATANGWTQHYIYYFNGDDWEFITITDGAIAYNLAEEKLYIYEGAWMQIPFRAWMAPVGRLLTDPPEFVSEGDRYLISGSEAATGAWEGHDDEIAEYRKGAWTFETAAINTCVYDAWTRKIWSYVAGEGIYWASTYLTTNGSGEINSLEVESSPKGADIVVIESAANTYAKYKTTMAEILASFILKGTGDPPDPTGLSDGTLYCKYVA